MCEERFVRHLASHMTTIFFQTKSRLHIACRRAKLATAITRVTPLDTITAWSRATCVLPTVSVCTELCTELCKTNVSWHPLKLVNLCNEYTSENEQTSEPHVSLPSNRIVLHVVMVQDCTSPHAKLVQHVAVESPNTHFKGY